ncbi:MAG: NERD domain-containing protein [Victivallales bacterium]|jgi:hypothetical protein
MARMIPSECSPDTESKAEAKLFEVLKKSLDDNWTVFHSFNMLAKNRENKLVDAEIDFLVFHKDLGLLSLEVKGGQISFRDGCWLQNGWKLEKGPVEQAKFNKYAVITYLRGRFRGYAPCYVGHAACFPDCFEIGDLPADCQGIVISGQEVPYIRDAIAKIMTDFNKDIIKTDDRSAEQILNFLSPVFEYGVSISDRIGQAESKILTLTELQCEMLSFISEHRQALVRGCAGSGKTVLAVKKAHELATDGRTVLLLAYNSMLCENLKHAVTGMADRITAITYHDLCKKHMAECGMKLPEIKDGDAFWQAELPAEFMKALEMKPMKFDAVIVDEGQDFHENYWTSVKELVRPDGWFYIFYDPDQNPYNKELKLPNLGRPFVLNRNCRNTSEIFHVLKPFCSGDVRISDSAPAGSPVSEFRDADPEKRRGELGRILNKIVREGKVYESQIVIIGGHSLSKTCLGKNPVAGGFTIVENGKPDLGRIPYFTYMKYKGCESDVVILLDVGDDDRRWNDKGLCTAISRARHLLHIIRK